MLTQQISYIIQITRTAHSSHFTADSAKLQQVTWQMFH